MAYQIFEMSDGQRVALYAQGNSVLYCLLPFARGMLPIEVKRDYLAHFEARVFRDTENPTRNLTMLRGILVRSRELESLAL